MSNITLVTGIWDIGRGELTEGWSRPFQHYLDKFEQLLKVEENLIIFGEDELEKFVFERRSPENTQFINRPLSWFQNNEFFQNIQKIRTNEDWLNRSGWLRESTQARLENYNPLVMSKVFLLNDAKIMDKFNSEYMFWIDGGLTNTVHPGYFTHDKVLDKLSKYISKFSFVCFPYDAETEIHGFEYNRLNDIAGDKVSKVARGGFFGGPKHTIGDINGIYYNLLQSTLNEGLMGTEELYYRGYGKNNFFIEYCNKKTSKKYHYYIENIIKNGLQSDIQLNTGGHIIIEKTEAFTSIDVNSGSFNKFGSSRETILWMNIAASKEIIHQIKLKNISGIIVIDFIDMSNQDDQLALLEYLNTQLQSNFSGSQIIQISEIGLVEITKQREGRNVYDMFTNHCLLCNGIGKIREEKLSNKISRYLLEFTYLHG